MAYQPHIPDERNADNGVAVAGVMSAVNHPHQATVQNPQDHGLERSGMVVGEEAYQENYGINEDFNSAPGSRSAAAFAPTRSTESQQSRQHRRHHHPPEQSHRRQSRPIAIVRPGSRTAVDLAESDCDTTDDDLEESMVTVPAQHQSLPSRLLRAPFLGSIPTSDEYLRQRNLLPPPMRLSDNDDDIADVADPVEQSSARWGLSYGSLRESHSQGRFLKAPLSLLDDRRRAGTSNGANIPVVSGLSIGERIQKQRKLQQMLRSKSNSNGIISSASDTCTQAVASSKEQISSLAAMMEASSMADRGQEQVLPANSNGAGDVSFSSSQFVHPSTDRGDADEATELVVLSSSLTGLQVLHGLPRKCDNEYSGFFLIVWDISDKVGILTLQ
jgi:hypothetical protein